MVTVFDFLDFRKYLRSWFSERKKQNCFFSYQLLAEKAGFNNKGFVYNIIQGEKKLTKSHCYKLSRALGHSKREAEYFEHIVTWAQAKNEDERSFFLARALQISGRGDAPEYLLQKDQYEFYASWQHSAVRSLINIIPVSNNFAEVGRMVSPQLTVSQVRKSVELLERLELIKKDRDGMYRLTQNRIRTSPEISQTARTNFHRECTDIAKQALGTVSPDKRNAVSITMGLNEKTYREVTAETEKFVNTIMEIVGRSSAPTERVYQYELLLFPLSKEKGKAGLHNAQME